MYDVDLPADVAWATAVLVALVLGWIVFAGFLSLGLLGWVALGAIAFAIVFVRRGLRADVDEDLNRRNCPECGARIDADAAECDYCGMRLGHG